MKREFRPSTGHCHRFTEWIPAFAGTPAERTGHCLIELKRRRGLIGPDAARRNASLEVALALDGRTGQASQQGELAHMGQGVGDWPLEHLVDGRAERSVRGEVGVQRVERREEAVYLLRPRLRLRVVPLALALGDGEAPIKKIADVRQQLDGRAEARARAKVREALGRAPQRLGAAIGECGDGVTEEFASGVQGKPLFLRAAKARLTVSVKSPASCDWPAVNDEVYSASRDDG
jgi:hypothetical protein